MTTRRLRTIYTLARAYRAAVRAAEFAAMEEEQDFNPAIPSDILFEDADSKMRDFFDALDELEHKGGRP
jgi:hypothetical protein